MNSTRYVDTFDDYTDKNWSNIRYDREHKCLSKTYGYSYPLQWNRFLNPLIIWEWNNSNIDHDIINPDYSIIVTAFDSLNVLDRIIESILKLTRGKWELIIVFDDVDNDSINYILNLVKNEWINSYIKNTSSNDCSLNSFLFDVNSNVFMDMYLDKYMKQTSLIYEYCVDYKKHIEWINKCGQLQRVLFIKSPGIWETSSNNLGMCLSSKNTKYFIHIQDDMQMTQIGWNINTILPLVLFSNDIFSVSARCVTSLHSELLKGVQPKFLDKNIATLHGTISDKIVKKKGRCNSNINLPLDISKYNKYTFYEGMDNNRGPWAVNASNMREIGYFNEAGFRIDYDIGEVHLRSLTYLHKHCGFMPLQFRADLKWGGTRRKKRQRTKTDQYIIKKYVKFRNRRRDRTNEYRKATKNKVIAHYNGSRTINMSIIDKFDQIYHFCESTYS